MILLSIFGIFLFYSIQPKSCQSPVTLRAPPSFKRGLLARCLSFSSAPPKRKSCPKAAFSIKTSLLVVLQPFHCNMCICCCTEGQSQFPHEILRFHGVPFSLNRFPANQLHGNRRPNDRPARSRALKMLCPKRKRPFGLFLFYICAYLLFFSHSIATCAYAAAPEGRASSRKLALGWCWG